MIEYILPHSPDARIIQKASEILNSGGLICLPTDTNWVLLADPYKPQGMEKLYKIKKENGQKHFSLLCQDISQASDVAIIDNGAFRLLKRVTPGHYTFIFEAKKQIVKVLKASKTDKEIGVRIIDNPVVKELLSQHGHGLASTNIPKSMLGLNDEDDVYSYMIEDSSLAHMIGMIIDPGEFSFAGPSTIVSFMDGIVELIREGAGDSAPFS